MSSQRKSTDCKSNPEDWGEELVRLHCLQALFPDWTGGDTFLLHQLKDSIETTLRQNPDLPDTFESFSSLATCLRDDTPNPWPETHAFVRLDFTDKTWDPLFARQELVRKLKMNAGIDHVFLIVRGLRKALFPAARYRTKARDEAYEEASSLIDELVSHWSTKSSKVHLLYL